MKKNIFVFGLVFGVCVGAGVEAMNPREYDEYGDWYNNLALQIAIDRSNLQQTQDDQYETNLDRAKRESMKTYNRKNGIEEKVVVEPETGLENSKSCMCCGYTAEEYFEETQQKLIWVRLGCGHVMCNQCFKRLKQQWCPFCKKPIEEKKLNRFSSLEEAENEEASVPKAKKKKKKKDTDRDEDESVNCMARGLSKMLENK